MPMLMRPSPLALEKISGFPSSWPSPIFIKIFSWVVSQVIGVLKPQKLSTNYSPNHSMVRPTTRTITSPCLRCLQSMRQRGLDMDLWWSYRLTIPPFNEFYEGETRTIWCKTVEDHQKSKWKGYGSCVFVLVHPKRHGIHSMSATTLKGP